MNRKLLYLLPAAALIGCAGGAQPVGGGGQPGTFSTVGNAENTRFQSGAPQQCANCGTVTDISIVEGKPAGVGIGTVIGAVIGGYAGSEVGSGSGRDAATAAGAVAGAYAGTQTEANAGQFYRITVRKDNGVFEEIYQRQAPNYGVGARVRLDG